MKSAEELLREEIRSLRDIALRLCQWGSHCPCQPAYRNLLSSQRGLRDTGHKRPADQTVSPTLEPIHHRHFHAHRCCLHLLRYDSPCRQSVSSIPGPTHAALEIGNQGARHQQDWKVAGLLLVLHFSCHRYLDPRIRQNRNRTHVEMRWPTRASTRRQAPSGMSFMRRKVWAPAAGYT